MKYQGLSLFASIGIAETYLEKCGITIKVASELLPERAKFHKHLYPQCEMIQGDINDAEIYNAILTSAKKNNCNFVIATPPCQGMSSAGMQKKDDPRNRLIIPTVKIIAELQPDFVLLENVPEQLTTSILVDDTWIKIPDYIASELGGMYYINNEKIVNAQYYGVPQSRERCVILLSKKELGIRWEFPEKNNHIITLREAIGHLPSLDPDVTDIDEDKRNELFPDYEEKRQKGLEVSKWHYPPKHKYRHVIAMQHTPEGKSAWDNQIFYPTLKDGTKGKGYKNTYKRQWWDKPAYTVTQYTSRIGSQENGHPGRTIVASEDESVRLFSDARVFSIYELMVVSSLPDDWNIPEWASSNLIRECIGEGVPPKLIEAAVRRICSDEELEVMKIQE